MTNNPDHTSPRTAQADAKDSRSSHEADRPPTESEERAAEEAATDVDRESVAENFDDMAKTGADVDGEGAI